MYWPNLKSVVLPFLASLAVEVLGRGCEPHLGEQEAVNGVKDRGWYC